MPVKKNINLLRKQIDFLDSEFPVFDSCERVKSP